MEDSISNGDLCSNIYLLAIEYQKLIKNFICSVFSYIMVFSFTMDYFISLHHFRCFNICINQIDVIQNYEFLSVRDEDMIFINESIMSNDDLEPICMESNESIQIDEISNISSLSPMASPFCPTGSLKNVLIANRFPTNMNFIYSNLQGMLEACHFDEFLNEVNKTKNIHFYAVVETWLRNGINSNKSVNVVGYNVFRSDRKSKKMTVIKVEVLRCM